MHAPKWFKEFLRNGVHMKIDPHAPGSSYFKIAGIHASLRKQRTVAYTSVASNRASVPEAELVPATPP